MGLATVNDCGPYYGDRCLDFSAGSSHLVNYSVSHVYHEVVYYPY